MADKKLVRLAAGALLLSQEHAAKAMRAAAAKHVAEAQAELQRRDTDRKAALLLALLAVGHRLAESLTAAIVDGRQAARRAAARRLGIELTAVGIERSDTVRPLLVAGAMARTQDDSTRAAIAAASLATQWRGLALASAARGRETAAALTRSKTLLASRIERTAITETAHAYNDEHRSLLVEAVRYGDIAEDAVMREWSALLDACERCWPLDGEQARVDESFPGGYEPGDVHPRCACVEIVVASDNSTRKAA